MKFFEKKYNLEENAITMAFHMRRRMFAIVDGKVIWAPEGVPYSHAVWFEQLGLLTQESSDTRFDAIVRGYVYDNQLIFYVGYDFRITAEAEEEFFSHLPELMKMLPLSDSMEIGGGLVKGEAGDRWLPYRRYGSSRSSSRWHK